MDIYPAIDIRNGKAVRLSGGDASMETIYHPDPVALAERFVWQGARWIHIVDLDRAFGDGDNMALVDRIVARVGSHVQLQIGGGFRTADQIRRGLDTMVTRLVLGTAAIERPGLVEEAVATGGAARVAVALDTREGRVAHHGWTETSGERAVDVARRVVGQGVRSIIYTDIGRDGMLSGPDLEGARALQESGAMVILSGGVSSLDDVRRIAGTTLAGVIIGRALYENRVTLPDALAVAAGEPAG